MTPFTVVPSWSPSVGVVAGGVSQVVHVVAGWVYVTDPPPGAVDLVCGALDEVPGAAELEPPFRCAEVGAVAARPTDAVAGATAASASVVSRCDVAESAGAVRCGIETEVADDEWKPICGHPRNVTNALARTNTIAAPASSDPAVPNPAAYALVARMSTVLNRQLPPTPLAISSKIVD